MQLKELIKVGRELFSNWKGTIVEDDNGVSITNFNVIKGKRIKCQASICFTTNKKLPYCFNIEEKTCEILGGYGSPFSDFEEIKKTINDQMAKFGFKQQDQISLFNEW